MRTRTEYLPKPATAVETGVTVLLCLGVVVAFAVLGSLEPDARGLGTHEQLGMTPCSWPIMHGGPCPTCGVTTSAVLVLQLRPFAAFATQPFGTLLTLAGIVFVVLGVRHAWRRESLFARMAEWSWAGITIGFVAVLLLSWWWIWNRHG